ncbi:CDP-alcohol phosphatidyltransferase-domain-containing protein [Gigaspora rosea]|uniref:CDP-alcohol phosphatidyltransferase-domain-containing protein n=1 Tax=Gigaspora rosea TaxID=44941 RepID=A0A397U574_9GLOM|nr:CDP-alcohol phosphatidyltransferase-domain-containing protein [Gigaspora rosea]
METFVRFIQAEYIGDADLQNLHHYKYGAIDKSPVANYILKYYWNWAVEFFPRWMAPNLITLCGLGFVFINVLSVIYWISDLVGPGPHFPVGLWLYSTFDNVDGKQARRTGTSSPLGELFDHGCDALSCSFGAVVLAAALGLGHTYYAAAFLLLIIVAFYMSTWEEYHTGVLYLGYFNGPTEGVLGACILMIISAIKGPGLWMDELRNVMNPVPEFIPPDWCLVDLILIFVFFSVVALHIPNSIYNVYIACRDENKSFRIAVSQLFTIALYSVCGYLWISSPHSYILKDKHFILFTLTVGVVFGRIATKIILAHLTKKPFPMYTVLLVPLFIGAVLTNIPKFFNAAPILSSTSEYYYLLAYFGFAVVAYTRWAIYIINKFCEFLNINCLRIPFSVKKDD